jgi:allophanate hydrolase subunit 1
MTMTCLFPAETPCGWHIIGRCPVPLWNLAGGASAPLLQPGDKVAFAPVSLREYDDLRARAADGRLALTSADNIKDAAA